jgi:exonuclease SbcC
MKSLKIRELELEGFRSFEDRTTITFPDTGMVLIGGRYRDGSMSSGSGKSTIPIAISFALSFCSLPATALKCWNSKKMFVRLRLSDGENNIDVIRDPKLKLIENGEEYKGLSKGAEERLAEILRTAPELMASLTYRPQRKHGRFLNSTDSDNKEFLSSLLGLGALEQTCDDLSRDKDRITAEVGTIEAVVQRDESMLPMLAEAKAKLPAAQETYSEAVKRYNLMQAAQGTAALQQQNDQVRFEIQRSNQMISQAAVAESDNNTIRSQLAAIDQESEILRNNICPTCKREWDRGQDRLDHLAATKKNLIDKARGNVTVIESVKPVREALPRLIAQSEALVNQMGQMKAPIDDALRNAQSATSLVQQLTSQSNMYDKLSLGITEAKGRVGALRADADVAAHASEMLSRNGFLSVIFDDVLREIEYRANQMVGKIPNVATLSLSISSTHNTKAGTTKKTISVKVIKDGEEVPVKALSGGQQCSLELCTDLAVSESIRSRSGSPIGWMCLDEAMDGLDIENKRAALDVIRQHVTGTVLMIDHSTEIKEGFEKVINIEFDGRASRVAP